jgi:hypothetical protein
MCTLAVELHGAVGLAAHALAIVGWYVVRCGRLTRTKDGRRGNYLKCNSWPSASISRTARWGWHMENEWVMYTTDPDDEGFVHDELDSVWDDTQSTVVGT